MIRVEVIRRRLQHLDEYLQLGWPDATLPIIVVVNRLSSARASCHLVVANRRPPLDTK